MNHENMNIFINEWGIESIFFSDKKEWLPEKEMIQELKMSYTLDLWCTQLLKNKPIHTKHKYSFGFVVTQNVNCSAGWWLVIPHITYIV